MNLLKIFGACMGGAVVGMLVGETLIAVKGYKEIRKEYPDMKTKDAIVQAAKDRVDAIMADPRAEISALASCAFAGIMYCFGIRLGEKSGYNRGIYDGIGKGADCLVKALLDACPDEFKKFIKIIDRKDIKDVTVYKEFFRDANKKLYERGYIWHPAKDVLGEES